ncbi:nuclear transport factor 2 family protein [bacterium AH-315-K03]|nr:nuclear transport factor 2 family protein [bacterium AH-315-K03]
MNSGPIEDRLEIRELMETFAVGAMQVDCELWGSTWAQEGSWKLPSMPEAVVGKEQVVAAFKEKMQYVSYMSMISFPAHLVVDGDRASGQSYCRELIYPKAGGEKVVVGYFDDEYVKRDGRWLFISRIYTVMGMK